MRVRLLELRLIAVGLAALWATVAVLLLAGYRPGGPADLLVGVAALAPLAVAGAAVAWPPAARGGVTFRTIVALGVATAIILVPTLASLVRQLVERGLQTLLPSPEAAYPWALAILGTSLFAGLGIARRLLGAGSGRPGRLSVAVALGIGLGVASGSVMAGATIANELALQDRPAAGSRYGPTDPALVPPLCDGPLTAGATADLTLDLAGSLDGGSLGVARARGERSGQDFRWLAEVTTTRDVGFHGAAVVGSRGWIRQTGTRWVPVTSTTAEGESLDLAVIRAALDPLQRTAAEDLGLVYVEGARARRCRVAVDGAVFRAAFPQVRWLVGATDLAGWRGEIDVWVFSDGQLGRAEGRLGGPGFSIAPGAIRGELTAALTATHRGQPVTVTPPSN
ncbi:MAG TPA: hypothetical protein VER83_09025 [Candidatus Nanopelagicales bacterium]|nr:hypothetical protein [Candidatus Nanopelagicales bacterium]